MFQFISCEKFSPNEAERVSNIIKWSPQRNHFGTYKYWIASLSICESDPVLHLTVPPMPTCMVMFRSNCEKTHFPETNKYHWEKEKKKEKTNNGHQIKQGSWMKLHCAAFTDSSLFWFMLLLFFFIKYVVMLVLCLHNDQPTSYCFVCELLKPNISDLINRAWRSSRSFYNHCLHSQFLMSVAIGLKSSTSLLPLVRSWNNSGLSMFLWKTVQSVKMMHCAQKEQMRSLNKMDDFSSLSMQSLLTFMSKRQRYSEKGQTVWMNSEKPDFLEHSAKTKTKLFNSSGVCRSNLFTFRVRGTWNVIAVMKIILSGMAITVRW